MHPQVIFESCWLEAGRPSIVFKPWKIWRANFFDMGRLTEGNAGAAAAEDAVPVGDEAPNVASGTTVDAAADAILADVAAGVRRTR